VQDYQNFLDSGRQQLDLTRDCPSVILIPSDGITPLAKALFLMGMGDDFVLTPEQELPDILEGSPDYPIYITLPPTQLVDFLTYLPESFKNRLDDFVFFSGGLEYGNIEDILKEKGKNKIPFSAGSPVLDNISTYSRRLLSRHDDPGSNIRDAHQTEQGGRGHKSCFEDK
jgi:hypothetical protein